jgi:hypothetical protein
MHIISTDEDPGLRIESFAVLNLRGVSTNKTTIFYRHANIQRTYIKYLYTTLKKSFNLIIREEKTKEFTTMSVVYMGVGSIQRLGGGH